MEGKHILLEEMTIREAESVGGPMDGHRIHVLTFSGTIVQDGDYKEGKTASFSLHVPEMGARQLISHLAEGMLGL